MIKFIYILLLITLHCFANAQTEVVNIDPKKIDEQPNPIAYIQTLYSNDSTDIVISSGPFTIQKIYKYSFEVLDKNDFELIQETNTGYLFRNCKKRELFELRSYFGDPKLFTITLRKFSKETALKVPYLKYGCH